MDGIDKKIIEAVEDSGEEGIRMSALIEKMQAESSVTDHTVRYRVNTMTIDGYLKQDKGRGRVQITRGPRKLPE